MFKAHRQKLREKSFRGPRTFFACQKLIKKYAVRFHIKIEQCSIQGDHIHLLIRCSHRFFFQAFFRVLAGQISQRFKKEGLLKFVTDTPKLWMHRPFTRVVLGFRAYRIVQDYIQLNEKEALGKMKYNSRRLRGLSAGEWAILWS